ncbi:hypothetical protein Ancab_022975 [Ancistrocladus abbreviatus]
MFQRAIVIRVYDNLGNVICHGKASVIREGHKSFPSGHSSSSIVTGDFQEPHLVFRPPVPGTAGNQMATPATDHKNLHHGLRTLNEGLKDICNMGSVRCSTVYPEKFSKAGPLWGTNSRDDDMCQIDDANDFTIGTSEHLNPVLLSDDFNKVIGKLSEGKASHIPYRYSKLTHLLQSSLSGRGHVLLICTVIPASSSTEETHNTLKFASRSKRVEIYASRNKIVDEKSLIKKYQRGISSLKQELDQLRRGMLAGISHEEIMSLRQQLEEGQVKMQSRLEEEEEAKAALMSRIQRLTKLILVSTKNAIPGYLGEVSGHQ